MINASGGSLIKLNSVGAQIANNATVYDSQVLAVDGLNRIWTGFSTGPSRVAIYGDYAESLGQIGSGLVANSAANPMPVADIAIDGSGNVWLANSSAGGLYEIVGAAAPVVTPRSVAAGTKMQGQEP